MRAARLREEVAEPGAPSPDAVATTGSALRLHRWRRLDWRFLLPAATPTRVAGAGAVDDELRASLPLLTPDVHFPTTASDWAEITGTCDVVVLVEPDRDELVRAVAAARPDGWIYAEVRRRPPWSRGPRSLVGWQRALRGAGLADVAAHWHAPDLATATRIVRVDATLAVDGALGRHSGAGLSSLRPALARLLLRCGLFPLAVAEGSVIGRRPGQPA
jgi:hypothetical protein